MRLPWSPEKLEDDQPKVGDVWRRAVDSPNARNLHLAVTEVGNGRVLSRLALHLTGVEIVEPLDRWMREYVLVSRSRWTNVAVPPPTKNLPVASVDPAEPTQGPQAPPDAVPDLANETFREFYARKYATMWPINGMALPDGYGGAISLLSRINEASADWMDALAKAQSASDTKHGDAFAAIMNRWEKETALLRARLPEQSPPVDVSSHERRISELSAALARAALRFDMLAAAGIGPMIGAADPKSSAADAWGVLRGQETVPDPAAQDNDLSHRFDRA